MPINYLQPAPYTVFTRFDRRKSVRERENLLKSLNEIETEFIADIFTAHGYHNYNDIYTFHLDRYASRINFLKIMVNPKYHKFNEYYFQQTFAPVENYEQ